MGKNYKELVEILMNPISGKRPSGGVLANSDGIPSIGGENIKKDGGMDYSSLRTVPHTFYSKMPKGKLKNLDVLINKDGALTGKVGLYKSDYLDACINEHVFILRSASLTILDQVFLYYSILL